MIPPQLSPEDLEFTPPQLPDELLRRLAADVFGLEGTTQALRGERDQNILMSTTGGGRYVLKVSSHLEAPAVVDLQTQALLHLEAHSPELPTPRVQPTVAGTASHLLVTDDGFEHVVRMLSFVEGDTFDEITDLSTTALTSIGKLQGQLSRQLSTFQHPAAERFMPWDISNGLVSSDALWAYARPDVIDLCGGARQHLAQSDFLIDGGQRSQVIHNDGHRGNILRFPGTIEPCGLIDFGDMLHAPLINELAVSSMSFLGALPEPANAIAALVAGFSAQMPLSAAEIKMLPDAITARGVLTALLFDFQIAMCPKLRPHIDPQRPGVLADLALWLEQDQRLILDRAIAAVEEASP